MSALVQLLTLVTESCQEQMELIWKSNDGNLKLRTAVVQSCNTDDNEVLASELSEGFGVIPQHRVSKTIEEYTFSFLSDARHMNRPK